MDYSKNYITIVEKTNERHHRSKIIIHKPNMFYLAEFNDIDQLDFFADMLGFTYNLTEEKQTIDCGKMQFFELSHDIHDPCGGGFWKTEELPDGVKPFKALSNGSIVTCYFLNDGKTIRIYRPNPNAKAIYKPLELSEHIAHNRTYGSY